MNMYMYLNKYLIYEHDWSMVATIVYILWGTRSQFWLLRLQKWLYAQSTLDIFGVCLVAPIATI